MKPTLPVLVGLSVLLLAAGLGLLLFGPGRRPQTVSAFFCLALLGATVTFGLLGATGRVRSRNRQVGGAAAVFVVMLGLMLPFADDASKPADTREVRGVLLMDGAAVPEARVVLLGLDRSVSSRQLTRQDNGQFTFVIPRPSRDLKFQVAVPGWGETTLETQGETNWVELRLPARPGRDAPAAGENWDLCRGAPGACTLYLFDYLSLHPNAVSANELQAFQTIQNMRLNRDIRSDLEAHELLALLDFRVQRCSAVEVVNENVARSAATALAAPAVLWGYIDRGGALLKSVMSITLAEPGTFSVLATETVGTNIIDMELTTPSHRAPLAIASLMVGEAYLQRGNTNLARRAFLHAEEVARGLVPPPDDLLRTLKTRLLQTTAANPAMALTPIGG